MILPVLPAAELKLYWTIYSEDEERKKEPINPHDVIDDFFQVYKLEAIRTELWGLLKFAIENGSIPGNSNLISDFVLLYEKLNDLITASYILHMDKPAI